MIKVLYGKKGMGKTKIMLETANNTVCESAGSVIYIDDSNELMTKLSHDIRFVNVLDYPIHGSHEFLGFICGIASQDYDLHHLFIDGLTYIVKEDIKDLQNFFEGAKKISEICNFDLLISINGDENNPPDFIKEFL